MRWRLPASARREKTEALTLILAIHQPLSRGRAGSVYGRCPKDIITNGYAAWPCSTAAAILNLAG